MLGLMFPPELSQVSRTRESIGPGPQTLRQNGSADTGQGMPQGMPHGMPQSPSQGLFAAYMNQLFQQKYRPQQALGGYQNMGGFGAFMPPAQPVQPAPPAQQATPRNQFGDNQVGGISGYGFFGNR